MKVDHKILSTADMVYLVGQLEHMRLHCLLAASNAKNDEEVVSLLVLAKQCMDTRRKYMADHFGNVETRHWCMVKVAGTLYQLMEELGGGDIEELQSIKNIADSAVKIATGEDITGCESCKQDLENAQKID